MPHYEENVYSDYGREHHGVEFVYEFDAYEPDYSFDILLAVKKDGVVYVATDSGCSCPCPFEDHTFPTDFTAVRSWDEVKRLLDEAFPQNRYSRRRNPHDGLRRAILKATKTGAYARRSS